MWDSYTSRPIDANAGCVRALVYVPLCIHMTLRSIKAIHICIKVEGEICQTSKADHHCQRSDGSLLAYISFHLRWRWGKQTVPSVAQDDTSSVPTRHFWGVQAEQRRDYSIPFLMEFISSRWWRLPLETPHLWRGGFRINQRACQNLQRQSAIKGGNEHMIYRLAIGSRNKG